MKITATAHTITTLWEDVTKPSLGCRPAAVAKIVNHIAKAGWAASYTVEDLLSALGCRMATVNVAPSDLGIQQRDVFSRPSHGSAFGAPHTAAADLAEFLIRLERLGFDVDPKLLVDALLPAVRKLPLFTQAELAVLWFGKQRHRQPPIVLTAKDEVRPRGWGCPDETITLPTGYIAEAWFGPALDQSPALPAIVSALDGAGPRQDQVLQLTVSKPKRSRLRAAA